MNLPGLGPDADKTSFPISPRQDRLTRMIRWLEFNKREVTVEMSADDVSDLLAVAEAALNVALMHHGGSINPTEDEIEAGWYALDVALLALQVDAR